MFAPDAAGCGGRSQIRVGIQALEGELILEVGEELRPSSCQDGARNPIE